MKITATSFTGFLLALALVAAIALAINWGVWTMWCWALPQLWASGPPGIIAPGFWLFFVCWTLITLLGRQIFGSKR